MEGVVALLIPIIAVGGFFAWMIALSPVGKAFAERLRGGTGLSTRGAGGDAVLQELEQLRHEVAELAERVDFTERLLAKGRGGGAGKLAPRERRTAATGCNIPRGPRGPPATTPSTKGRRWSGPFPCSGGGVGWCARPGGGRWPGA